MKQFCLPNSSDNFCLLFCLQPSSMWVVQGVEKNSLTARQCRTYMYICMSICVWLKEKWVGACTPFQSFYLLNVVFRLNLILKTMYMSGKMLIPTRIYFLAGTFLFSLSPTHPTPCTSHIFNAVAILAP